MDEELQARMRSTRLRAEEDSEQLKTMVDSMVLRYGRELDEYVEGLRVLLAQAKRREAEISDQDLEQATLRIPVFMYFAASGLEHLGLDGDSAGAVRKQVFAEHYLQVNGTIPDKTKQAELETMPEVYVEMAFQRAYKLLKAKVDKADAIFSGFKKVLSKRMQELDVVKRELGTNVRSMRDDD